jgi:hypothetical protein
MDDKKNTQISKHIDMAEKYQCKYYEQLIHANVLMYEMEKPKSANSEYYKKQINILFSNSINNKCNVIL